MCGPLSQPASSEHHASFNGKTDAPLLTAPKPGKKDTRNKSTRPVGRGTIEKVSGACVHGFTLLQRRTMGLTGVGGRQTRGQGERKDVDGFECGGG